LHLDGLATVADVHLNGERLLESDSMFVSHRLDVGELLRGDNELAIRCRALEPLLQPSRRPRARWRTQLVAEGNLRFFRTMLIGRAPGFAPEPPAVGPWRPVRLERRRQVAVDQLDLRPRLAGADGVLTVRARLRALDGARPTRVEVELAGPSGTHRAPLALADEGLGIVAEGEARVPAVTAWWPHTHGEPALHEVRLLGEGDSGPFVVEAGRVGFRAIAAGPTADHDPELAGLDLHVNGVRVFARGAVWTPVDAIGLAPSRAELRAALESARDAGMNMLRVPGIGAYETDAFHDLCDELGLLVWQDFMFANLDYPISDPAFRALVEREASQVLAGLAGRPSLAVLCGNSEVEQQVAMLGLDPALGRGELFGELLPGLARAAGADAVYFPSAPSGGDFPFRPDRGVANYFGVGAYLRPLEDARRAGVRFASECLAFANVPAETAVEAILPEAPANAVAHHPRWKAGVPRDAGSGWDFEDVRDHYLELLFGVNPTELRSIDHDRYLELSRAVTGEVMAEVFGEWRRAASVCGGGLVLWLRDLVPGAGWGVVDHDGEPKVAYHHLRRALAPVAVWTTDEGLGGVVAHVANDRPAPLTARLRVSLYRDLEHRVDEAEETIELAAHGGCERNVESLFGRFFDASWAYRFGPPAQDVIVVSLERDAEGRPELLSQSMRFPAGRPLSREPGTRLGLEAEAEPVDGDVVRLTVRSRRLAYGVRVHAPGFIATDDAFSVEPGGRRVLLLRSRGDAAWDGGRLTALNLEGGIRIASQDKAR
jgi:beta-mannosidase